MISFFKFVLIGVLQLILIVASPVGASTFAYVGNGPLRFIEPDRNASIGQNVFNVVANGETKLENFDILKTANVHRTVVTRTFPVKVVGRIDFSIRMAAERFWKIKSLNTQTYDKKN